MDKEIEFSRGEKIVLHICGVTGLIFLPITWPVLIGIYVHARRKSRNHASAWLHYCLEVLKFAFHHDLKKLSDAIDRYDEWLIDLF